MKNCAECSQVLPREELCSKEERQSNPYAVSQEVALEASAGPLSAGPLSCADAKEEQDEEVCPICPLTVYDAVAVRNDGDAPPWRKHRQRLIILAFLLVFFLGVLVLRLTSPTTAPAPVGGTTPAESITTTSISTTGGPLEVSVKYDISNDCGLDSEAIMNPADNNDKLKHGLIGATTAITISTLNETFPRVEEDDVSQQRNLVYYTDEYPVTIDRIIDIVTPCDPGQNCLLVVSTITVMLEEGDDPAEVYDAINDGMKSSFGDGSFFAAIPEDTVICP